MNLTHDPWMPMICQDGSHRLVSLHEAFASAHEIRDLSAKPYEKIALLRLLICITQAALDGPKDFDAWKTCRSAIPPGARKYLEKWQAAFELFGDGPRFLQVPGLKPVNEDKEETWATKLNLAMSSGRNATLFDNAAHPERRVAPAKLAISLLTFQSFSPGSPMGVALWNGAVTKSKAGKPASGGKTYAGDAPCLVDNAIHTFLAGANLLETLRLNLLTKEKVGDYYGRAGWGSPVWESVPAGPDESTAEGKNAVTTYLGRLVPMARAVLLRREGDTVVVTNGLDYAGLPVAREPSTTCLMVKDKLRLLKANLGRSLWRQLPAILVKRIAESNSIAGPLALQDCDGEEHVSLWVSALVADETNSAKLLDAVEAAYDIPAEMFRDAGRKLYEEGVALADAWQDAVWKSVKGYAATLKLEPPPYDRARQHFWTAIEQHVPVLLRLADKPEEAGDLKSSEWGKRVKEAAHAAFEFAVPHQTPRQIQAYSIGRQQLFLPKPKDPSAPTKKKAKARKTV